MKKKIFEKIYFFNRYDWIVSKLYECLSTSQLFSRKILLTLLTKAQEHKSWIVRYSIYKLLIIHSGDENFLNSIINNISQDEKNIKSQLLAFILFYEFEFSFDYEKIIDNLNT